MYASSLTLRGIAARLLSCMLLTNGDCYGWLSREKGAKFSRLSKGGPERLTWGSRAILLSISGIRTYAIQVARPLFRRCVVLVVEWLPKYGQCVTASVNPFYVFLPPLVGSAHPPRIAEV